MKMKPCPTHGTDAQFALRKRQIGYCAGCQVYLAGRKPAPRKTTLSPQPQSCCQCHKAESSVIRHCPVHGRTGYEFGNPS